ncbi:hypothetical protein IQ247_21495 [Plectonema cf. radiosum LEGE 06105]|uniref:Uncharacterized protein n=1 Tax=Plectonema cf. radiosum LEGE 06105 TaxID=945769 RepID=A0A8J7K289_9CYAN|nr:hypothetical protein [Plectonema radiosum]MBE9215206.1 hypothetical protein [Plectonema cf. radiosum LEGE 06105]
MNYHFDMNYASPLCARLETLPVRGYRDLDALFEEELTAIYLTTVVWDGIEKVVPVLASGYKPGAGNRDDGRISSGDRFCR